MIQILQTPVPDLEMFDIGNDKFSMVSAKVIIGQIFPERCDYFLLIISVMKVS